MAGYPADRFHGANQESYDVLAGAEAKDSSN
jgi:hypothetical protein